MAATKISFVIVHPERAGKTGLTLDESMLRTMPFAGLVNAGCLFLDLPQEEKRYRLLDLENGTWATRPVLVKALEIREFALVHEEAAAIWNDDAAAITQFVKSNLDRDQPGTSQRM
jgi:hypothetical protein